MKDGTRFSHNEGWNKGQEDWIMELWFHKMKDRIKVKRAKDGFRVLKDEDCNCGLEGWQLELTFGRMKILIGIGYSSLNNIQNIFNSIFKKVGCRYI